MKMTVLLAVLSAAFVAVEVSAGPACHPPAARKAAACGHAAAAADKAEKPAAEVDKAKCAADCKAGCEAKKEECVAKKPVEKAPVAQ